MEKSSVSALQEYCAHRNISNPVYEYVDSKDGSFVCRAELLDMDAVGNGRSKRDAKHQAASEIIEKLRFTHPDIDKTQQASLTLETSSRDMIEVLNDYCIKSRHPLPTMEIVEQSGTPGAPKVMVVCSISSIKRYGVSEKEKDALQLAASEMYKVIRKLEQQRDSEVKAEEERCHKFKTFREFTGSKTSQHFVEPLCDRHNFFTHFYEPLKAAARAVIAKQYESSEVQALDVLRALKLKPKITPMKALKSKERMLFIELDCEYDAVFAGLESEVYDAVVRYFRDML